MVDEAKLRPFLDKWHLIPGAQWQAELEDALRRSKTIAVFIGPSGNGPWHHEEMQVALMRAVREKQEFRVIPVLLPEFDASSISEFLQLRTWVDFSAGTNNDVAFPRLVAGILGKAGDGEFAGITLPDEPAPYRGLLQFKPEHARFFFGREQVTQRLIEKLRTHRFVATVGSSGSGKSSIVGAGLLPRLAQDAIPDSKNWRAVTFTPADDPWRSLAVALASSHPPEKRGVIVTDLLSQFDEPGAGLRHTLETWFADTTEPLLLFVDQFEELFTHAPTSFNRAPNGPRETDVAPAARPAGHAVKPLAPDHAAGTAACDKYDERIGHFVRQLAYEVLRPDGRFRAVITLRADFMPHCLRMPKLKGLLQDRQLLLGELATDEAALREVIQRPAQEVGALLETGLMEVLLADVRRQTGALPLLEHALSELWRERRGPWLTLAAYKETGGVSGALEQRAEETLQRLIEPQQRIARHIFVKLTSLEEDTENTRRRVDRKALYAETTDSAEIDAVINILAGPDARLIVADANSLSIAHETLIQNWPRLRTWLAEDRQLERIHRELEEAANQWKEMGRGKHPLGHTTSVHLAETEEHANALADRTTILEREFFTACRLERDAEKRRLRRNCGIAVAAAIFTIVVTLFAGFAWWRASEATTNATIKEWERDHAALDASRERVRNFEERGRQFLVAGDAEQALAPLSQAYTDRTNERLGESASLQFMLARATAPFAGRVAVFRGHQAPIISVKFRRDEKQALTVSEDGNARLWDTTTGRQMASFQSGTVSDSECYLMSAVYSPDGTRVITIYRSRDMEFPDNYSLSASIRDSTNGDYIGSTEEYDQVKKPDEVELPIFSEDGRHFFLDFSEDRKVAFDLNGNEATNVRRPQPTPTLPKPVVSAESVGPVAARSRDGSRFVTNAGVVYRTDGCVWLGMLEGPLPLSAAEFTGDDKRIVAAHGDVAILWDLEQRRPAVCAQLAADGKAAVFAGKSPHEVLVASQTHVEHRDLASGKILGKVSIETPTKVDIVPIPMTTQALVLDHTRRMDVWDVDGNRILATFQRDQKEILGETRGGLNVYGWRATGNGEYLVVQFFPTLDETLSTRFDAISLATGRSLLTFEIGSVEEETVGQFDIFIISPNGKWALGSAEEGRQTPIWVSEGDGFDVTPLDGNQPGGLDAVVITSDSTRVIGAGPRRVIRIWDINHNVERGGIPVSKTLTAGISEIETLALSHDDRFLLASNQTRTQILDLTTQTSIALCEGITSGDVWAVSADNRFVVTAGPGATARILELETGRLLMVFRLPAEPREDVRFNAAGDRILVQAGDLTQLWDVSLENRMPSEISRLVDKFNSDQPD